MAYIYNVTVNIEPDVEKEWLGWMKKNHIPDVMKTGLFLENRILKLLTGAETNGSTYAIQYTFSTMEDYEKYRTKHAPALQQDALKKFGSKFVAFRTLLEIL